MHDVEQKFLYLGLIKFAFRTKGSEVKSDLDFFRRKESRIELREEFTQAVRSVFLKYLLLVDRESVDSFFSDAEKNKMRRGFAPLNWSVHHQKPLSWGGCSFNPEMFQAIQKVPLTEEQERDCQNNVYSRFVKLGYQMDNFLQNSHQKGTLKKDFVKLFRHYLILMPRHIHEELETNHLMPQVEYISKLKENAEDSEKREALAPLSYILWDQFIYKGTSFPSQQKNKIVKVKEDCLPKRIFKRKNAYVKYQKQRND